MNARGKDLQTLKSLKYKHNYSKDQGNRGSAS